MDFHCISNSFTIIFHLFEKSRYCIFSSMIYCRIFCIEKSISLFAESKIHFEIISIEWIGTVVFILFKYFFFEYAIVSSDRWNCYNIFLCCKSWIAKRNNIACKVVIECQFFSRDIISLCFHKPCASCSCYFWIVIIF